jgi:hypothetical protein
MASAIELIVGTYVRLKNRRALEEMLLHRQRLSIELSSRGSSYDVTGPIRQVEEDIVVLKAGIAELGGTAPVPCVSWSL